MRSRKPSFGGVPEKVALTAAEAGPTTQKTDVTTVHVTMAVVPNSRRIYYCCETGAEALLDVQRYVGTTLN